MSSPPTCVDTAARRVGAHYDGDLRPFRLLNAVRDTLGLAFALGHRRTAAVVGHDFGAAVAAWCALVRPDAFASLVLMSAPFAGPPELPLDTDHKPPVPPASPTIHEALAALARPRKHYQWYYSTRSANGQMRHCRQGVHDFLRAYFHHKSADWKQNRPHRLASWSAAELAKMPTYYIMDLADDMATTVAKEMPSASEIATCKWLPDHELAVYTDEYQRNGFQGGLNWYRTRTSGAFDNELQLFSDRTIDVPSIFIAGKSDLGVYQQPGVLERMQERACTKMVGCTLFEGAGHWVQQEQPEAVSSLLIDFLRTSCRLGSERRKSPSKLFCSAIRKRRKTFSPTAARQCDQQHLVNSLAVHVPRRFWPAENMRLSGS
jgi:pimeloyl-ACP methyl ester carboxylesterase